MTPAQLWKSLPLEKRVELADAFWRESDTPEVRMPRMEATGVLARKLNFRAKSVQTLPIEKRARYLAQLTDISETIASRALIAYHFATKRPLMAAFLDRLG